MGFSERLKKMLNMSNEKGNKIVITGALGYIGSHTAIELIEAGYEVCLVDNLACTNIEVLEGIEKITDVKPVYENIDCKDYVAMDKFMSKNSGIKAVIHCAALKNEGMSDNNPLAYYRNNLGSLVTLLELLPIHKINQLICTVPRAYEDSVYRSTLEMGKKIINDVLKVNRDLHCTIVQHAVAIGAHPTSLIGFAGDAEDLQAAVARVAAGRGERVMVNPARMVDYIDIKEIARKNREIFEKGAEQVESMEIIDLNSGVSMSDVEFVKLFEKANNAKVSMEGCDAEPEVRWNEISNMEECMKDIWHWQLHLEDLAADGRQRSGHLLGGS